jgi:hypothetical protein
MCSRTPRRRPRIYVTVVGGRGRFLSSQVPKLETYSEGTTIRDNHMHFTYLKNNLNIIFPSASQFMNSLFLWAAVS